MGKAIVPKSNLPDVLLITPGQPQKIGSIHLPQGDWIVFGKVVFLNLWLKPLNADLTLQSGIFIDETDGLVAVSDSGGIGETMLSVMGPAEAGKEGATVTMFAQVALPGFVTAMQIRLLAIGVDSIILG